MASLNFDAEKNLFKEHYESNAALWSDAVNSLRTLLQLLLVDQNEFSAPTVQGRLKTREECIAKFSRKYQLNCEKSQTPYEIKDYITDLIGLRVIGLYETDIPLIRIIVEREFTIIEETDKTASIESHVDTFGYKGLHLDLKLKSPRVELPEYHRFRDVRFELQVRTIVQDSWSVLDHKIKYKKNIPDQLRRRINRLAALFELADQEFVNIRHETQCLEKGGGLIPGPAAICEPAPEAPREPSPETPTITPSIDMPLDVFRFSEVAHAKFPTYRFDGNRIDSFLDEIKKILPDLSARQFESVIDDHLPIVEEYRDYQRNEHYNSLNPYTEIRHCLYLSNKEHNKDFLFELQRINFDRWLTRRSAH